MVFGINLRLKENLNYPNWFEHRASTFQHEPYCEEGERTAHGTIIDKKSVARNFAISSPPFLPAMPKFPGNTCGRVVSCDDLEDSGSLRSGRTT